MHKKLYLSKKDKKLAGVCGGIAAYLNIDSTVVRLVWALVCALAGTGVLAYIICAFVIPDDPNGPKDPEDLDDEDYVTVD